MPKKAFVALAVTLVATAQAVVSADAAAPPAIAAAARGAARSESGTSPASLVSRPWTRNVIAADWTRQHFPAGPVGVWKLVFRPDGVVEAYLPRGAAYPRSTTDFTVRGSRLTIASYPECDYTSGKGSYAWKISGNTLTLTKIVDGCGGRAGFYSGRWTRR
jgi:hypothetical protein